MLRVSILLAALASCAPTYALATHKTPPTWLYAADMVAFSVGACVGLSQFNSRDRGDSTVMWLGFGPALAVYASYWLANPEPQ